MPRIQLKPKSPHYADQSRVRLNERTCEMPGCRESAQHKAPKDRSLSNHYWFCYEHVSDYNKAWDFFSGMNDAEIQDQIFKSYYGDRPTWRYDVEGAREEMLYRAAWQTYNHSEEEPPSSSKSYRDNQVSEHSPEGEALAIFDLSLPLTLESIKKRYKELAKKFHPDLNRNDPKAEETLKKVNMAYTVLKLAYARFEKIEK